MFTKTIAVVGAALLLGVFAVTTDAFAQSPRPGGGYTYKVSPSGNLVVRGAPNSGHQATVTGSGARVNPSTGPKLNSFNANPTPATHQNNGSNFAVGGPYIGLKYRGNQ